MTISTKPEPAPGWLRELADARAAYQELLGWPVSVQVGQRNLVVRVGRDLDAVTMPAVLGVSTLEQLRAAGTVAPAFTNSAGTSWTFLVGAGDGGGEPVPSVTVAAAGSYVAIPSVLGESAGPGDRWVSAPVSVRMLPGIGCLLTAAGQFTGQSVR